MNTQHQFNLATFLAVLCCLGVSATFAQSESMMVALNTVSRMEKTGIDPETKSNPGTEKPEPAATDPTAADYSPDAHEAKSHVGADNKLYWQKQLPVYLFVSPEPSGSGMKKLESQRSSDYSDPLYLDTEGVNFIRHKWAVDENGNKILPEREVMFEIYADGTPPSTSVSFNAARYADKEAGIFYGKDLEIAAEASDGMSKVDRTFFRLNTPDYSIFQQALKVGKEGAHELDIYTVDNVGNTEEVKNFRFTIDITSPATAHSVEGDFTKDILSTRATIKLTAEDALSGTKTTFYKLDEEDFKPYHGTMPTAALPDGEHTLTFYSVDKVKNNEAEKVYTFYMDKTPPVVEPKIMGDLYKDDVNTFISDRTNIALEASDNKSGLQKIVFKIDNAEEVTYTEKFPMGADGIRVLTYYGVDNVNNSGDEVQFRKDFKGKAIFRLDSKAPALASSFTGKQVIDRDTTFITSDTKIVLTAKDGDSGVKNVMYQVNSGEKKEYSEPFTLGEEGFYKIAFDGTDQVNNAASDELFFVIDNTGPVVTHVMSSEPAGSITLEEANETLNVYSRGVRVYLAATDGVIDTQEIYYTLNGGPKTKYVTPITLQQKGENVMEVTSFDQLGNESEEKLLVKVFVK